MIERRILLYIGKIILKPSRASLRRKDILEDNTKVVVIVPVGTKPFTYVGPKYSSRISSEDLSILRNLFRNKNVLEIVGYQPGFDTYKVRGFWLKIPFPWVRRFRDVERIKKQISKITL